jgi:hypothetical protein
MAPAIVAVVFLGVVPLGSAPAQALPKSWAIVPTPANSSFNGISCVSASFCVAVGGVGVVVNQIQVEEQTLVDEWNGSAWSTVRSPNPVGSAPAYPIDLTGVSCSDADHCVAVGDAGSPANHSFSEIWNGSSWSLLPTKNPGTEGGYLSGVSCASTTMCVAVGYQLANADGPYGPALIESWNGTAWSVSSRPDLSRYGNNLEGVSCVSTTNCTAVGNDADNGSGGNTLVERWNGVRWHAQTSVDIANTTDNLSSVSCLRSGTCVAVGTSFTSATWSPLAEVRTGGTWSISTTPTVSGSNAYLAGVSCTSASNCVAVGNFQSATTNHSTLIEEWNGMQWTIVPSPSVANQDNYLYGAACTGPNLCFAVGGAPGGLLEQGT